MTDAEQELKKLPPDAVRKIFTAWHAPQGNYRELTKRFSDSAGVLTHIAALTERKRRMLVLLAFDHAEVDAGSLVSRLHEPAKREAEAFLEIQDLAELGFFYLRRKRGRLNQIEDKIFMFTPLKNIVRAAVLRDLSDANPGSDEYDKTVLKKHERAVLSLYEAGGKLRRATDTAFTLPIIAELARARIVSLYLVNDPVTLGVVLSPSVTGDIERRHTRDAARLVFSYNHFGIVNDLESFLYAAGSHRIRRLKNGNYDLSLIEKNGLAPVTPAITAHELAELSRSLGLSTENADGDLVIAAEMFASWRSEKLARKMELIRSQYRERSPELVVVRSHIREVPLTIITLAAELNRENSRYTLPDVTALVRTLYMLGEIEAGGANGTAIESVRAHADATGGKCIVSNSFEVVLMEHTAFDAEFMYLLMSFARRVDQTEVHTFIFTEETVLKAKHLISAEREPLDRFLTLLTKEVESGGKQLSKNVESSLRRWYDRAPEILVRMRAVLLEADTPSRLAELAVSAKKEGIVLERIAERHAVITSSDSHDRKITRFLRKEKMIARIVE